MDSVVPGIRAKPASQQPVWADPESAHRTIEELSHRAPLVRANDVAMLRELLAGVARGEALVAQCGDCAEPPDESTVEDIGRKSAVLAVVASSLQLAASRPVIRVGRIAGQFSKPRSRDSEAVGGVMLPPYRGHMVNRPEPTAGHRRADPANLLLCYAAAEEIVTHLGWRGNGPRAQCDSRVWTSHEALLLDYELPMIRRYDDTRILTSTHFPWVGERTRQVDGAHVALLASVANPVAVKVGPGIDVSELLALCERLDPDRAAGRLTLICRMGAAVVADRLPALVAAVRAAGHPVVWLSDPMHGNTVVTPEGLKTRLLDTVVREVREFQSAVVGSGGVAGGLHLETTPDDVTECVQDESFLQTVGHKYTTLCDPRLNPRQAASVASAWRG